MSLYIVPASAIDFDSLAENKIWLNQLQYRKTLLGSWKSEADGAGFFISSEGKHSPVSELKATYELLTQDPEKPWGYIQQPVICAFPTRKKFLEDELGVRFRDIPCVERETWKKPFQGSQFYLIYSSAYPNNPASMFGHTFALFSKHSPPDSSEGFLDYSVNFSADTSSSDEESLFYTVRGIFGGYPARYRLHPFYQMVNLYINWESRDLWYLKVPWTDAQVDRYLNHIWEIFTTTHFDYFFFDENCSYRLLAAMDYADPNLNLNEQFYSRFPIYYVSPLATYKALEKFYEGRSQEQYTPSLQKSLKNEIHNLNLEEKKLFDTYVRSTKNIPSETNVKVLDTLITYFDYKKRTASNNYLSQQTLNDLDKVTRQRAQQATPSISPPPIVRPPSPLRSHGAHSFLLGAETKEGRFGGLIGGKVAYHDLLSPTAGFERWSHLNFLEVKARYGQALELDSFVALNIMSFFPILSYDSKLSWRAEVGYDNNYYSYLRGGAGAAFQTVDEMNLFYVFVSPVLSGNIELTRNQGFVVESEVGVVKEFGLPIKLWLYYRDSLRFPVWNFSDSLESLSTRVSISFKGSHEIRFELEKNIEHSNYRSFYQINF